MHGRSGLEEKHEFSGGRGWAWINGWRREHRMWGWVRDQPGWSPVCAVGQTSCGGSGCRGAGGAAGASRGAAGRQGVGVWCTGLRVLLITWVRTPLCELCSVTQPDPGNIRVSFLAFRDILWRTRAEENVPSAKRRAWEVTGGCLLCLLSFLQRRKAPRPCQQILISCLN